MNIETPSCICDKLLKLLRAKLHTMYCLDVILKVVQAREKVTKMLAFRMWARKLRIAFFMPQMNILDMIRHVRNTLEHPHPSRMR